VFAEPQFEARVNKSVIEGTKARSGTLDPEGTQLTPGPELYATLMRNLAQNLKSCLAGN
jgi:zinc transport system substrate-binding protein